MKKALFKVVIPAVVTALWLITCYPVCNKAAGFDLFLYWILAGCPFGIRRMHLWLMPKNFGIGGSMGVLALDCIIGGVVLLIRVISMVSGLIKIVIEYFRERYLRV